MRLADGRLFAARETDLQAEISTLADPALHARLVARGYEPRGFDNMLDHPRTGVLPAAPDDRGGTDTTRRSACLG